MPPADLHGHPVAPGAHARGGGSLPACGVLCVSRMPVYNSGPTQCISLSVFTSVCLASERAAQAFFVISYYPRVCSIRHVPRRTGGITGTGHFGKFGTASIPTPETSVSSVRHQYRFRILRQVRCINTSIGGTGMHVFTEAGTGIGTTSIPVSDTSVRSAQHQPGTGHFGTFGTISTRFHHIVTSSLGALVPGNTPSHTHPGPQASSSSLGIPRL